MRKILFFLILVFTSKGFSQNMKDAQRVRIVSHTVALGETVRMISKKYLVEPCEIYRLNKDAINGVSSGIVLRIPIPIKDELISKYDAPAEVPTNAVSGNVLQERKETQIAFNSKKEIDIQEISTAMVVEKKMLKKPNSILIADAVIYNGFTTHIVKRNETFYSLSKLYNISIEVLKNNNLQTSKKGIQIGQSIKIPTVSEQN